MKIKRILSLFIALLTVCLTAACGESGKTEDTAIVAVTTAETETAAETEPEDTGEGIVYAGTNSGIVRDGTPKKYFTISFDDGITQDLKVIEIYKKYNFTKGTFFIDTGLCGVSWPQVGQSLGRPDVTHLRFTREELESGIYDGYDVEVHTLNHLSLKQFDRYPKKIKKEVMDDAQNIYEITGIFPVGMAWPGGDPEYTDKTVQLVMENTTMGFARGLGPTYKFDLPTQFMKWMPTCSVNDARTLTLLDQFLEAECTEDMLFYTWCHGYELDVFNLYGRLEEIIRKVTEADDVVLVTNAEFYQLFKDQIPAIAETEDQ